ncbi:NUDIX hydrolase domain-like protein [Annulohypoxylon maeteangense]|uniref:NUDIX hydrolase domain-like protein n=1 Tax=Annulohypoxylon maeteangense TaxID=1927788 RepID=UPI00200743E9|nr:NUDIX hydrolase domain-like protein [Annulohypoxylon maeteangense]KAI0881561.1 NUDIX hydrolase domain-like protein [Annulohypoxylon maeteangense]
MATNSHPYHVRVGVAVLIRNSEGKFVFGKRKGSHGAGTWQFPGGHLEMGESFFACAERETLEETGLKVIAEKVFAVTNDVFDQETKHYITVFVTCRRVNENDQPEVLEPEKCESWNWIGWNQIRQWCEHHDDEVTPEWAQNKCFLPIRDLVKENPHI